MRLVLMGDASVLTFFSVVVVTKIFIFFVILIVQIPSFPFFLPNLDHPHRPLHPFSFPNNLNDPPPPPPNLCHSPPPRPLSPLYIPLHNNLIRNPSTVKIPRLSPDQFPIYETFPWNIICSNFFYTRARARARARIKRKIILYSAETWSWRWVGPDFGGCD